MIASTGYTVFRASANFHRQSTVRSAHFSSFSIPSRNSPSPLPRPPFSPSSPPPLTVCSRIVTLRSRESLSRGFSVCGIRRISGTDLFVRKVFTALHQPHGTGDLLVVGVVARGRGLYLSLSLSDSLSLSCTFVVAVIVRRLSCCELPRPQVLRRTARREIRGGGVKGGRAGEGSRNGVVGPSLSIFTVSARRDFTRETHGSILQFGKVVTARTPDRLICTGYRSG